MSPLTKNFKSLTNNKVSLSSNGSCGSAVEPASCYQKELKCPRYWTPNCWWAGRHHQCVNVCEMLNVLNVNVTLRWTWSELIRLSSPQVNNTHTHTHTHTHTISATSSLWFEFSPQIFFTVWLRLILLKYKGAYCPHLCVCLCVCVCVCVSGWFRCVCVCVRKVWLSDLEFWSLLLLNGPVCSEPPGGFRAAAVPAPSVRRLLFVLVL